MRWLLACVNRGKYERGQVARADDCVEIRDWDGGFWARLSKHGHSGHWLHLVVPDETGSYLALVWKKELKGVVNVSHSLWGHANDFEFQIFSCQTWQQVATWKVEHLSEVVALWIDRDAALKFIAARKFASFGRVNCELQYWQTQANA